MSKYTSKYQKRFAPQIVVSTENSSILIPDPWDEMKVGEIYNLIQQIPTKTARVWHGRR
jgi:hypothetical protein